MSIFPFWSKSHKIKVLRKVFVVFKLCSKNFKGWGWVKTPSSPNKLRLEALFQSISIHKMVLNFMRNGPFGRVSVHYNNGQGNNSYVMIPASGYFAEMLTFQ